MGYINQCFQNSTQIEIFEKLKLVIQINEAKYFANEFWKSFFDQIETENFDQFLENLQIEQISKDCGLIKSCVHFSKVAKFFLEYDFDEIMRKNTLDRPDLEQILE